MIARDRGELDRLIERSGRIGFVPTMGALHRGHIALIERSLEECDQTVVSIFVNPTQFNDPEDLKKYPRTLEEDLEICRRAGVNAVLVPEAETVYQSGYSTFLDVEGLSESFEGEFRPGHFRGVATVCYQLFKIVEPDAVFFGRKDLQQARVVERMILDMRLGIDFVEVDTVRESNGLAMSSRNRRLTEEEFQRAASIHRELSRCAEGVRARKSHVDKLLQESVEALKAEGFEVEYFELVDGKSFGIQSAPSADSYLIVAAWLGAVRLIDNLRV